MKSSPPPTPQEKSSHSKYVALCNNLIMIIVMKTVWTKLFGAVTPKENTACTLSPALRAFSVRLTVFLLQLLGSSLINGALRSSSSCPVGHHHSKSDSWCAQKLTHLDTQSSACSFLFLPRAPSAGSGASSHAQEGWLQFMDPTCLNICDSWHRSIELLVNSFLPNVLTEPFNLCAPSVVSADK